MTQPPPPTLLYLMKQVELAVRARLDEITRPSGLTALQYTALTVLERHPDLTAAQALEQIRKTGRGKETLNIVYVVDPATGKLVDDLRLGAIVLADPDKKLTDLDDRQLVSLLATATRDEVIKAFEKYDRVALPVTNADGHMLGIITIDDEVATLLA